MSGPGTTFVALLGCALALLATPARAQGARDSVIATVQEFFRAMTAKDVEATRRVMTADGQYYVDAFSLIRTDHGWQIASVIFTIETDGCPPSPLGPLPRR